MQLLHVDSSHCIGSIHCVRFVQACCQDTRAKIHHCALPHVNDTALVATNNCWNEFCPHGQCWWRPLPWAKDQDNLTSVVETIATKAMKSSNSMPTSTNTPAWLQPSTATRKPSGGELLPGRVPVAQYPQHGGRKGAARRRQQSDPAKPSWTQPAAQRPCSAQRAEPNRHLFLF